MQTLIPTYLPGNQRIKDRTLAKIEELRAAGKVVVTIKRGRIVRATYREEHGANPFRKAPHRGTRYSFEEKLPSGQRAWKHAEYPRHLDLTPYFEATRLSIVHRKRKKLKAR